MTWSKNRADLREKDSRSLISFTSLASRDSDSCMASAMRIIRNRSPETHGDRAYSYKQSRGFRADYFSSCKGFSLRSIAPL
jgi:hypothetical protein